MGFSRISQQATALARRTDDALTLTFGKLNVYPNTPNVIAGEVVFTADCRHADEGLLDRFCARMRADMQETAANLRLDIAFSMERRTPAAALDADMNRMLEAICQLRGVPNLRLCSGAGHDTQVLSAVCPSTLIFVPSVGGVSHSPDEYTEPGDLSLGVEILEEMLYRLAYETAGC